MPNIKAIVFEHGKNDFEIWSNFSLSDTDEKAIFEILKNYETMGESVRGDKITI